MNLSIFLKKIAKLFAGFSQGYYLERAMKT